ncbi:MAG: hypothetical protein ACLUOI_04715 [Eisenbergiella sp.]
MKVLLVDDEKLALDGLRMVTEVRKIWWIRFYGIQRGGSEENPGGRSDRRSGDGY